MRGRAHETRHGHLGVLGRDSQFRGDDRVLSSFGIRRGSRRRRCERILHHVAPVALGFFGCAAWPGILAAVSRQAMRGPRQIAVIVVLGMILFPQQIAGFIADLSSRGSR